MLLECILEGTRSASTRREPRGYPRMRTHAEQIARQRQQRRRRAQGDDGASRAPGRLLASSIACRSPIAASSLCATLDNAARKRSSCGRSPQSRADSWRHDWRGACSGFPDGRFIIGTNDGEIKMCNGSFVHTIDAHTEMLRGLVVLPDGRFVSGSNDYTAKLWRSNASSSAPSKRTASWAPSRRCQTACTLWSASSPALKLYHIDGTLVHVFEHADPDDDVEEVDGEDAHRFLWTRSP